MHRRLVVFFLATVLVVVNLLFFLVPELAWRYASQWTQANLPLEGPAIRAVARLHPHYGLISLVEIPEVFAHRRCNPSRAAALMRDQDLRVAYLAARLVGRDVPLQILWDRQQEWFAELKPLLVQQVLRQVTRRDPRSRGVTWRGDQATCLLALLLRWVEPSHWPKVRLSHELAVAAAQLAWGDAWQQLLLDHINEGHDSPWLPFAIMAFAESPEAALAWSQRYPQASRGVAQDLAAWWLGSWKCVESDPLLAYVTLGMGGVSARADIASLVIPINESDDQMTYAWGASRGRLRLPQPRIMIDERTQMAVKEVLAGWLLDPRAL